VSCISLGSYCAVAAALNHLKLRSAAFPFDWNRTTMEGVIHFLETGFSDFLNFLSVKDFPGGKQTGGKAYCGAHHSVWHEDLATEDGTLKYERRITRFYQNTAQKLLFIRAMNSSTELMSSQALLRVLQGLFPQSQVYLLLIAVCQPSTQSMVVEGTSGRLLVHCTPQWSVDGLLYTAPIRAAYEHAAQAMNDEVAAKYGSQPMHEVLQCVQPYFGGRPQQVPFSPQMLYMPQVSLPIVVAAPHVGPVLPLLSVPTTVVSAMSPVTCARPLVATSREQGDLVRRSSPCRARAPPAQQNWVKFVSMPRAPLVHRVVGPSL